MTVTSLIAVIAPRTGKIIKNGASVCYLLQNGILKFGFKLNQSTEIVLQS